MPKYKIEITETLQKVVEVEAETLKDAFDIAEDMWNGNEIMLYADDFKGVEFSEYEEDE